MLIVSGLVGGAVAADLDDPDIMDLDLEDLFQIKVTLVSRKAEDPMAAPAAVFVLSGAEIRRAGATSLPEALRLVPGMHVARIDANQWAVTARGGNLRFANKLLVLIDGRSVYTPLFSGVYWEGQDLDLGDVDRIEVVRGPGATLWGANAVNGIINIITRAASQTQGVALEGTVGTEERGVFTGRYGGRWGEDTHYRVYGKTVVRDASVLRGTGEGARDGWRRAQVGFRVEGTPALGGEWSLQGDAYGGRLDHWLEIAVQDSPLVQRFVDEVDFSGLNALGRWRRDFAAASDMEVLVYVDRTERADAYARETRTTVDLDLQHRFGLGRRHELVWGAGVRSSADRIDPSLTLRITPSKRRLDLFSGFVQDNVALWGERVRLTVGTKVSHDEFDGWSWQPNARLAWQPVPRHALWGALARARRNPSRAEEDAVLLLPGSSIGLDLGEVPLLLQLSSSVDLRAERLTAVEAGYRFRPGRRLGLELSVFRNRYRGLIDGQLANPEIRQTPVVHSQAPVLFGNIGRLDTRGLEVMCDWQPWMHGSLKLHYSYLDVRRRGGVRPPADPAHQFLARVSTDIGRDWQLDGVLRYVGGLQDDSAGAYTELDLRLGYALGQGWELALVGQNLLHRQHDEFVNAVLHGARSDIQRGAYATLRWQR